MNGNRPPNADEYVGTEIAVVGMACRFPDAPNPDSYWRNLREGVESVRPFAEEDLRARGVSDDLLANPDYVRSGVVLDDVDQFDAGFFGFSPLDASIMDPQHRVFLECAWEALEHAGYDPGRIEGAVGVYGGCGMNAYMMYHLLSNPELMASSGEFLIRHTGNDKDFLTTRVSYELDLRGPSVNVQTACSTSLVAVHMAIQSLLTGECDTALAGGVTISLDQEKGYLYQPGEILSPDGHCRSFDVDSSGTIFGSGAGLVVLKRLSDALTDGDSIHAVLLGSAVNNDGRGKVGYMAPSVDGQAAVVAEALSVAGVSPRDISFIEAHGTGTPVGDPIEIAALTEVHRKATKDLGYCGLGTVKTNIGHLDTAAGVAGLIKVVEALKHKELPPTLHFSAPNPRLELDTSPFYVVDRSMPWPSTHGKRRRAGVSSLGVGGTNAHVVLEEAPELMPSGTSRPNQLVCLSAKSDDATMKAVGRLADFVEANPDQQTADVAFTLQSGRKAFPKRSCAVVAPDESLAEVLRAPERVIKGEAPSVNVSIAFMFAGGGVQHPGMGSDLYESEPVYKKSIDEGLEVLRSKENLDLRPFLLPEDPDAVVHEMERPSIGLPSLFITQMALSRLLGHWGITPDSVIGHSVGEYAAACLAGVIGYEDALRLVALRGRLFESLPEGGMLSVALSEQELRGYLNNGVDIAAVNGEELCVASGPVGALDQLEARLNADEVDTARLKIAVAAHSSMVEEMLEPYSRFVAGLHLAPPKIRFASNLSGTWLTAEEAVDTGHWTQHVRETVRFADGLNALLDEPNRMLIEIGPGRALASLARQHPKREAAQHVVTSMRHPRESAHDQFALLQAIGEAWAHGVDVDWKTFYEGEERRRVPLPTYPFERQRYWIEPGNVVFAEGSTNSDEPTLVRRADVDDWFESPVWEPVEASPPGDMVGHWLVLHSSGDRTAAVLAALVADGVWITSAELATELRPGDTEKMRVRANEHSDFDTLLAYLESDQGLPDRILVLDLEEDDADETRIFTAVFNLMKAIGSRDPELELTLDLVTRDSQSVVPGDLVVNPSGALLLGPARVLPNEFPNVRTRFLDVDDSTSAEQVVAALASPIKDPTRILALRGGSSYAVSYQPTELSPAGGEALRDRNGVFLITGGLGGVGLGLAQHLGSNGQARLALLGRSAPSARASRIILDIEAGGTQVLTLQADVTVPAQLKAAIEKVRDAFGPIDVVFHAAGVLADGPVLLKTADDVARVLAPKVKGARTLVDALSAEPPDHLVFFSSTSAALGLAGQIDYSAANAYLNAYSTSLRSAGSMRATAVNWGIWRDVGMAARLGQPDQDSRYEVPSTQPVEHGIVKSKALLEDGEHLFAGELSTNRDWIVDEHRFVGGQALLPGTAFLDLAFTTLRNSLDGAKAVEVVQTTFLSALTVDDEAIVPFRVLLIPDGDGFSFQIASEQNSAWVEHAVGSGKSLRVAQPLLDLDTLRDRCTEERHYDEAHPRLQQEAHLSLGERWRCVRRVARGERTAIATLELAKQFAPDLGEYPLHPALLDLATGVGLDLLPGDVPDGLFVPVAYERVRIWESLPDNLTSVIRLTDYSPSTSVALFDIQLCSIDGLVLVDVEGLSMKLIPEHEVARIGSAAPQSGPRGGPLDDIIENGIRLNEGMEVLKRVVFGDVGPELIASPVSLDGLRRAFAATTGPGQAGGSTHAPPGGDGQAVDAAPRDEIEQELVALWQDLLGASSVGIHDDFFELGGHSLLAVRLFARLERQFQKALPLATLFEAPTPAKLGVLVRGGPIDVAVDLSVNGTDVGSSGASVVRKHLVMIQQGEENATPFYCVHGAGGNVLNFRDLAVRIGASQPFYGLQARGADGREPTHETIEEMASAYLAEIRLLQPHGPYMLGGYSGGGVVAYEMALQLQAVGETVGMLAFLDTFRPGIAAEEGVRGRTANVSRLFERGPRYVLDWARKRYEFEKWRRTKRQMEGLLERGEPLPIEMREIQMTAAYHSAENVYEIRAQHSVPITLFTAKVRAAEHEHVGFDLGWEPYAQGGLDIQFVPGDHDSLMRVPNVEALASKLRLCIAESVKKLPSRMRETL